MRREQQDFMALAKKRFLAARHHWTTIREDFRADLQFVNGDPTKQWPTDTFQDRRAHDLPALTFDRCNPRIQAIVNKARRDRPEPKVIAGDEGDPEVADLLEGKVRHIFYSSQASVPFDDSVMYCAAGGFGVYRLVMEWVHRTPKPGSRGMWIQEPRIKGIQDPLNALYMDPAAVEPHFADAKWWFIRERIRREFFKDRFGIDPVPFDHDLSADWENDDDNVWVAEYHCVEESTRRYVQLHNGDEGYFDEFEGLEERFIVNSRELPERHVTIYLIDGERVLEATPWPGDWIPIFIVRGEQVISDSKIRWKSALRYARDPQHFLNASISEVAIALGTSNMNGWVGPRGSFKDGKWRSNSRQIYREYDPVVEPNTNAVLPPPARDSWQPPIDSAVKSVALGSDALNATMGYQDSLVRPSQTDLSGVAVQRREEQTDAANSHYRDNLVASQWHLARCMIDLIVKTTDTPRMMTARTEDGHERTVPVGTLDENGQIQLVPGHENEMHHRLDIGEYGIAVKTGKSYETRAEEEADRLAEFWAANPVVCLQFFGDIFFEKLGYHDLAERAKFALAPQVQQAIAQDQSGAPPDPQALKAQMVQLITQNQQLKQGLQQALQLIKSKGIETQGRLAVETTKQQGETTRDRLQLAAELVKQHGEQAHDHHLATMGHAMDAVDRLTELLHESELAPSPIQQGLSGAGQPLGAQPTQ